MLATAGTAVLLQMYAAFFVKGNKTIFVQAKRRGAAFGMAHRHHAKGFLRTR